MLRSGRESGSTESLRSNFIISNDFFGLGTLSEIQNSLKLVLHYLTKRCLKYYLGREQLFDKGLRVQFSIFSEIGFEKFAYVSLALLIKVLLIK